MHPVLIEVGGVPLYAYGFMMAVAFLAGVWVCARRAPAFGLPAEVMYDSAVTVLATGLVVSKLAFFLTNGVGPLRTAADVLTLVRGGFVYYGGVAGGAAGAVWWLRRHRVPVAAFLDVCAPALCFAHAIGRLGCFLNGCCYGRPVRWGIAFPSLADGMPRHPTQLYEAAAVTLLGLLLLRVPPPPPDRSGRVFGLYLLAYAPLRFALELLRDDPRGPMPLGFSVSQWLGLAALAAGAWLLARRPRPPG